MISVALIVATVSANAVFTACAIVVVCAACVRHLKVVPVCLVLNILPGLLFRAVVVVSTIAVLSLLVMLPLTASAVTVSFYQYLLESGTLLEPV